MLVQPTLRFLEGGGEMGRLVRCHDWAATPLGTPEAWSQSLKTAVRLVLSSGHPMLLWWGPELIQIYNDAHRGSLIPNRHPGALGQAGKACWPEIWDVIGPQIAHVMAGSGSVLQVNQLVPIMRHGRISPAYWTYSCNPIDESGTLSGVGGVLLICQETTEIVQHEQRRDALARRQQLLFEQAPGFVAILSGPSHVFEFVNRSYRTLFGSRDFVGETVRDVFPEIADQGFYEALDATFTTGKSYVAHHVPVRLQKSIEAPAQEFLLDFIYEPVFDDTGIVTGIFVQGNDVTEAHLAHEALRALERRQTFRISLDEALRSLSDPSEIMAAASKRLGRQLGVGRCGYAEIDDTAGLATVAADWTDGSMPSVVGQFPCADIDPQILAEMRSGQTCRVADHNRFLSVISGETDAPWGARARASVSVPLLKGQQLVAFMYVHQAEPRSWIDDEEELVRETAERTRAEVTRGRAETALRQSEEEYRDALEARVEARTAERDMTWRISGDLFLVCGFDGLYRSANPAWSEALGYSPEELTGTRFDVLAHPDDLAATRFAFDRVKQGKVIRDFGMRMRARDGRYVRYSWLCIPEGDVFYASGRAVATART